MYRMAVCECVEYRWERKKNFYAKLYWDGSCVCEVAEEENRRKKSIITFHWKSRFWRFCCCVNGKNARNFNFLPSMTTKQICSQFRRFFGCFLAIIDPRQLFWGWKSLMKAFCLHHELQQNSKSWNFSYRPATRRPSSFSASRWINLYSFRVLHFSQILFDKISMKTTRENHSTAPLNGFQTLFIWFSSFTRAQLLPFFLQWQKNFFCAPTC